jgi:D-glycero-D-manno-heptose 1,7-bisphosphate phosphatase
LTARAVFLDRDGVLNEAPVRDGHPLAPQRPEEVALLPGVINACHQLAEAGWLLVVVTNQPDIARGHTTRARVDAINRCVTQDLPISEVVVCPHDDADGCICRKPQPGMLLAAAERWDIELGRSWIVGDRWRDVEAGRKAGVRTVFVDHGYAEAVPSEPDHVVADLPQAASLIVGKESGA